MFTFCREWYRELDKRRALEDELAAKGKKPGPGHPQPSLSRALMRVFFWQNVVLSVLNVVCFASIAVEPVFHGMLIKHFRENEGRKVQDREDALLFATYIVCTQFLTILMIQHGCRQCFFMGMRMRVACCTLIYRKVS